MLKKRDLSDCGMLFELMQDPAVFPFVRQKADSLDAFLFLTKQTIESEDSGTVVSRTIVNEWGAPIGTITLFDIENGSGFLGTWIGKPYFGKGYNQKAKEAFFNELFLEHNIETVFMKIRRVNGRSLRAAGKLPYAFIADRHFPDICRKINSAGATYHLFAVTKEGFLSCRESIEPFPTAPDKDTLKEA